MIEFLNRLPPGQLKDFLQGYQMSMPGGAPAAGEQPVDTSAYERGYKIAKDNQENMRRWCEQQGGEMQEGKCRFHLTQEQMDEMYKAARFGEHDKGPDTGQFASAYERAMAGELPQGDATGGL